MLFSSFSIDLFRSLIIINGLYIERICSRSQLPAPLANALNSSCEEKEKENVTTNVSLYGLDYVFMPKERSFI